MSTVSSVPLVAGQYVAKFRPTKRKRKWCPVTLDNVLPGSIGAHFRVRYGDRVIQLHSSQMRSPDGRPFPVDGRKKTVLQFLHANCLGQTG